MLYAQPVFTRGATSSDCASDRMEEAVLPLTDGICDILQLAPKVDFADQSLKGMALQVFSDRIPIHGAGALESLSENLAIRIVVRAGIVVRIDAGDVFVELEEGAGLFVVGNAAEADDVFC